MHAQNKEGIFVIPCSDLRRLFSVRRHQSSTATRTTFQLKASAFAFNNIRHSS